MGHAAPVAVSRAPGTNLPAPGLLVFPSSFPAPQSDPDLFLETALVFGLGCHWFLPSLEHYPRGISEERGI